MYRHFETEEEITRKEVKKGLSKSPEQSAYSDAKLHLKVYNKLLDEMGDIYRKFLTPYRKQELFDKAKKIAETTEGMYQIRIMEYRDLIYAMKNDSHLVLIGFPAKNSIFALIDDDARFVGVYMPMAKKQREINEKIEKALFEWKKFIESKGIKMNKEIEKKVVSFLWEQKFPQIIPDIKIIASKSELVGDFEEVFLEYKKWLQLKFENNMVYYHVK